MQRKLVQEEIVVEQNDRLKIVRQDRHEVPNGDTYLEVGKLRLTVLNYSSFGILIKADREINELMNLKSEKIVGNLVYNGVEVQTLSFRIVRFNNGNGYRVACEVIGEPININLIRGIEKANALISAHKTYEESMYSISSDYRRLVWELRDSMANLATQIWQIEAQLEHSDSQSRLDFESAFCQTLTKYLKKAVPQIHSSLQPILKGMDESEKAKHAVFFRNQLAQLIYDAPFSDRAYNKPRGYAGDYEMMNHLYKNEYIGKNLFARCLHHYFINEPAGQAVRNRRVYLTEKICSLIEAAPGSKVDILSVASGPAGEMQDVVKILPNPEKAVNFFCLDQDEESLKGAQFEIKRKLSESDSYSLNLIHNSIKTVVAKGLGSKKYDLIYSAGLFDYFSDPVAQMAGLRLFDALKPGGTLIIGNFSLNNPTLPLMDLAWDWHLIYRSEEDMANLFRHLNGRLKIEAEPLGINLFCVIEKE